LSQLVHISGIGADAQSRSSYIRSRGQGELAVRTAYPGAILVRPSVMFAPDDAFLSVILKLLQRLPAYPIFGSGTAKLQPTHVDDVAEAIARIVQRTERDPITLECGGPRVYTYKDLVRSVAREAGLKPTQADSSPVCRLACCGPRSGVLAEPAHHAKPGRAHAD
jgi:NADH dehydrogenase